MRRAKVQKRAKSPKRYDDVDFEFFDSEGILPLTGSVRIRDTHMVIDIPEQSDFAPCLVEGVLAGHVFSGRNTLRHEEPLRISARWADLGDRFVGEWIENGNEFLFSFRLPKSRRS